MLNELLPMLLTLLGAWALWSIASTAIALIPDLVPARIRRETRSTAEVRQARFRGRRRRSLRRAA